MEQAIGEGEDHGRVKALRPVEIGTNLQRKRATPPGQRKKITAKTDMREYGVFKRIRQ